MKIRLLLYPLLTLGAMLMTGLALAAQTADSARVNELLQQAKRHAIQADRDAQTIESYTRSTHNWQSHAYRLNTMRDNVNEIGKDVAALHAIRTEASPWQLEAIDTVDPLLRSMADHLTAMINHLNENQARIHFQAYREYATANVELSQKMLATINDYVDYAKAKARSEALEQKLQLGPETGPGI